MQGLFTPVAREYPLLSEMRHSFLKDILFFLQDRAARKRDALEYGFT